MKQNVVVIIQDIQQFWLDDGLCMSVKLELGAWSL